MIFLVVNYHYFVAEPVPRGRAIFPTSADTFRTQLEALGRYFEFVARDELAAAVAGDTQLPPRACVITFDDGLTSQYRVALAVLEELGVPGIFFIPGQPLAEGRALLVHKIHYVREQLQPELLLSEIRSLLPELPADFGPIDEAASATYRYDRPADAAIKYLLNFTLDVSARERLIDALFAQIHGDESGFCRDLYLSAGEIRELEQRHRAIGAHSYYHRPLGRLSASELRDDLGRSQAVLSGATGASVSAISYPYGSREAVTPHVAAEAKRLGYRFGFTMERAFNRSLDDPLLLARVDTNDAMAGRSPLFNFDATGALELAEGMSQDRRWYAPAGSGR